VVALKNRRWKNHERQYGDPPGFRTLGAHQDPSPGHNREVVERWLSFVVHGDDRIGLPTYAALMSETVYRQARATLSAEYLEHSLDYLLKHRAALPFRVDADRGRYRVRRALAEQSMTDAQEEALLRLTNYLALRDVATDLLEQFADDVAGGESYADIVATAERLQRQIDESD
jgi:hypothetical protein